MFNLIKRNMNKKNRDQVISTATMSTNDYIKAVEGGILPYWADQKLMEKTGITNLFDGNAKVIKDMSYEDACDCAERALKLISMASYVCDEFKKRSDDLQNNAATSPEEKSRFYSANTIRDLFIEAHDQISTTIENVPKDTNEAIVCINDVLMGLDCIKQATLGSIVVFANAALEQMTGF